MNHTLQSIGKHLACAAIGCFLLAACAQQEKLLQEPGSQELLEKWRIHLPQNQPLPTPLHRYYTVTWSGLHVGDLHVSITPSKEEEADYHAKASLRARGLAHMVSGYGVDMHTTVIQQDAQSLPYAGYQPKIFRTSGVLRAKRRDIHVTYDEAGHRTHYTNQPKENPAKRPPITDAQAKDTLDPITLGLVARKQIYQAVLEKRSRFTLPLFDGRRLSNITFTIKGITQSKLLHVAIKRDVVAGYTQNELKKIEKGPTTIHLYLSTQDWLPVKARGKSPLGNAWLQLEKDCSNAPQQCPDIITVKGLAPS